MNLNLPLCFKSVEMSSALFLRKGKLEPWRTDRVTFTDADHRLWKCKRMPDDSVLLVAVTVIEYGEELTVWSLDPDVWEADREFYFLSPDCRTE